MISGAENSGPASAPAPARAWVSASGVVLADRVPAALRRRWAELGYCPDRDLYSLFREHVRACPDRAAVAETAETVSYAVLDQRVRRIAAALTDAGLGPRDIIGIQLRNEWRAVAAELAVAAIGAVALPYPAGRGRRDSVSLLGRARARAVIAAGAPGAPGAPGADSRAACLAALRPDLPHLRTVFTFGAAPPGCSSLDGWLADSSAGRSWRPAPVDPEAPARILVSSGSEAEPKMAAYSHNAMAGGRGNYIGALRRSVAARSGAADAAAEPMRSLILVPLSSSYGSCGTSVTIARHGGTILLLDAFDPVEAVRMIVAGRPSLVFGVPTMLSRMAELPGSRDEDFSSLHALVSSAALLPAATAAACRARFGCPVVTVYGSTDGVNCHMPVPSAGAGEFAQRVGRPDPAVAEIRISGHADGDVPPGMTGEIWARGPMTPLCYVNAPELDVRYRAPGGWVRTGDLGLIDADDYLRVVGRIRQVIVRGGYTISPAEVEREISAHPAVADAACVAVPHADLGERVCACVVLRHGSSPLTVASLGAFLEAERGLERRKLPELLLVLSQLPLGPTGKVCRHTLARLAAQQYPPPAGAGEPPATGERED